MSKPARRRLALGLLVAVLAASALSAAASAQAPRVRRSILNAPDQAEAYRRAVAAMQRLPVSDPRSWYYQAAMHRYATAGWVRSSYSGADLTEVQQYILEPPPHARAHRTWAQCHRNSPDPIFLLWHRVYLHFFEQIAREVSGQPDFTLPYWDYTRGANGDPAPRRLPAPFRAPRYTPPGETQPVNNPLYAVRRAEANEGRALRRDLVTLDPLEERTFARFGSELERVHGLIHTTIGKENGVLMGTAEMAALDPIFWVHHANVDRLWSCWQRRRGNVYTPSQLNQRYVFIDRTGTAVTLSIADMERIAREVDYTYESYADCERAAAPPLVALAELDLLQTNTFALRNASAELRPGVLPGPGLLPERPPSGGFVLDSTFAAMSVRTTAPERDSLRADEAADRTVLLQLTGVEVDQPVGLLYLVRVRPEGSNGEGVTVGLLGFFGQGGEHDHAHEGGEHDHAGEEGMTFEFDITDALAAQSASRDGLPTAFEVLLVPTSGLEEETDLDFEAALGDATPRIAEVRVVTR